MQPMGKLLSVNVGTPRPLEWNGRTTTTGIVKTPVEGEVFLYTSRLVGDGQANLEAHGRPFQAVYAYPSEHYPYWQKELDREPFPAGMFGENFTTEGMSESDVHLGDIYRIGSALVQVTSYRYPCGTLAMRMQLKTFPKLFLDSLRCGWYMRVLEEGTVEAGDLITLKDRDDNAPTVKEMLAIYLKRPVDAEGIQKILAVESLAEPMREQFEALLDKAT